MQPKRRISRRTQSDTPGGQPDTPPLRPDEAKPGAAAVNATSAGSEGSQLGPVPHRSATQSVEMVTLTFPLMEPTPGTYIASQLGHLEVTLNWIDEDPGFRLLHAGLRASNATLQNDRPVTTSGDVVRWLMQQITTGSRSI